MELFRVPMAKAGWALARVDTPETATAIALAVGTGPSVLILLGEEAVSVAAAAVLAARRALSVACRLSSEGSALSPQRLPERFGWG